MNVLNRGGVVYNTHLTLGIQITIYLKGFIHLKAPIKHIKKKIQNILKEARNTESKKTTNDNDRNATDV